MIVLELFSGTESFSKEARAYGYKCVTLEIDPSFKPTIVADILEVDINKLPKNPNIIWASPPCQAFTTIQIPRNWTYRNEPKTEKAVLGLKLLSRAIEIISILKPTFWIIENPRGKMRKVIETIFSKYGVTGYKRQTVTYCQYGTKRMKPTDFWSNILSWSPKPMCKNGDSCHESVPRGCTTSGTLGLLESKDRAVIPTELCREILDSIHKPKFKQLTLQEVV